MESLAAQFGFGDEEKAYLRSMRDNPPTDEDEGMKEFEDARKGNIFDDEETRDMATQTERLDTLITKLRTLVEDGSMSHEARRTEVRRLLFDPILGVGGINRDLKSGQPMEIGSKRGNVLNFNIKTQD